MTPPPRIRRRIVVHFPGFEPLDAHAHHQRYQRSSAQSGSAFGFSVETRGLATDAPAPCFEVSANGPNWSTQTSVYLLGHQEIIAGLKRAPFPLRMLRGYAAAGATLMEGAFLRYLKVAWRFALFFLFPFLVMALCLFGAAGLAVLPVVSGLPAWNLVWSMPLSALVFGYFFMPWVERAHTQHLFAHWQLAVKLSRLDDDDVKALMDRHVAVLVLALDQPADEYLISAHSLGGTFAIHALGGLIERHPQALHGKSVALATLAGPGLQSSLMNSAIVLRRRIKAVLTTRDIFWIDFQCLTDPVNFFRGRAAGDNGFGGLDEPAVRHIRIKHMLSPERYRRIKWDGLRVHRQFVLGSDRPSCFDFTLLTAGPFSSREFASFNYRTLPPLATDGAL